MEYRARMMLKEKTLPALLSVALGIVIIIARRSALDLLVKIVGGLIIAGGVAAVAVYLNRKDRDKGDLKMVLIMAAAAAVIGLLLISLAESIVDFFPTLMGIFLILNGLSHLTMASVDEGDRVLTAIMGVIVIIFGVLIVMRPGFVADAVMVFIGAFFIVNGLFDLFIVKRFNDSNLVE